MIDIFDYLHSQIEAIGLDYRYQIHIIIVTNETATRHFATRLTP